MDNESFRERVKKNQNQGFKNNLENQKERIKEQIENHQDEIHKLKKQLDVLNDRSKS